MGSSFLIWVLLQSWVIGLWGCASNKSSDDNGNAQSNTRGCTAYVDYMCQCHPEEDCDALSNQYDDPSTEDEEDCAELLDQQKLDDGKDSSATGEECSTE